MTTQSPSTKTNVFAATVENGVWACKLWQSGRIAERSQWEQTYLTTEGRKILSEIGFTTQEAILRQIVLRAVAAK